MSGSLNSHTNNNHHGKKNNRGGKDARIAIEEERKLISRRVARAREEEKRKQAIALFYTVYLPVQLGLVLCHPNRKLAGGNGFFYTVG